METDVKFKLLVIKSTQDLEETINDFIQGKQIMNLHVQCMLGSHYSTHQVYITYKHVEEVIDVIDC